MEEQLFAQLQILILLTVFYGCLCYMPSISVVIFNDEVYGFFHLFDDIAFG
jgi:hypothetical protein